MASRSSNFLSSSLVTITVLLLFVGSARSQELSVAFWNVRNLFDTIPSPFDHDDDYTPDGKYNWTPERYINKVENISAQIDKIGVSLFALCEVESEEAIRDIVKGCKVSYSYIFETTSDPRSMSLALLYQGDKFFPEEVKLLNVGFYREVMQIRGELITGEAITVIVGHLPSRLGSDKRRGEALAKLNEIIESETDPTILLADMNCTPDERVTKRYFPLLDSAKGEFLPALYYRNRAIKNDCILLFNSESEVLSSVVVQPREKGVNYYYNHTNIVSDHDPIVALIRE